MSDGVVTPTGGKVGHRFPAGIGSRLRQLRGELSQAEFAEKLRFHKNTYADWERENSEIGAAPLARLAEMGANVEWLLTGRGEPLAKTAQERADSLVTVDRVAVAGLGAVVGDVSLHQPSQSARLNVDKLCFALEIVEEALAQSGRTADPLGKAQLVAKIYETFLQEADVAKATATVLRLIRTGT